MKSLTLIQQLTWFSLSADPWKMAYKYQKGGLYAIPLMKCIPPPGFRISLADIFRAQLGLKYWTLKCVYLQHFEWSGGVISSNKLYISAVRQAYLDTTGLCAFDEGYASYSPHLIPIHSQKDWLIPPFIIISDNLLFICSQVPSEPIASESVGGSAHRLIVGLCWN